MENLGRCFKQLGLSYHECISGEHVNMGGRQMATQQGTSVHVQVPGVCDNLASIKATT